MKIEVKKINKNWAVVVESEHGRGGIYFQGHGLHAAKRAAAELRGAVKRHGAAAIDFEALA